MDDVVMNDSTMVSVPEVVCELAESWVRFFKTALDIELDYTQETLPILDYYLEQLRAEDDLEKRQGLSELVAPAAAAYFSMVLARSIGEGRFIVPEGEYEDWRFECEHCFLYFKPVSLLLLIISADPDETIFNDDIFDANFHMLPQDEALVSQRLEDTYGSIKEDDYLRLSVRFDVFSQIYELLCSMSKRDENEQPMIEHVSAQTYERHITMLKLEKNPALN